jgi:glycolate oxidase
VLSAAVTRDLRSFLGDQGLSSTPEDRACYSYDAAVERCVPDLVVFPATEDHVIRLMRYAHRRRIPVVPHGAGSGCSGGGLPVQGGILVSFERMNRILSLAEGLMVGQVEPGVITAHFQREVERRGLFYPPDPSSAEVCTLGGNVAHGAGGLRGRKYGTTKDYVLGLQMVTADGELARTGFFASGQTVDLTGLLVGSEGTLAVVTRIALRLVPKPESFCTLLLAFCRADQAVQMAQAIFGSGLMPAAMEFMDQRAVDCVREYGMGVLPRIEGHILLVEFSGRAEEVLSDAQQVEGLGPELGALEVQRAQSTDRREEIWSVRRALSPAMAHAAIRKISQDVCVPPKTMGHLLRDVRAIGQKHGLLIINFGHLGDGNLHVNVMTDGSQEQRRRAQLAVEELFCVVLALDGTLSGEHGIGLAKAQYLSWELSPQTLEAHRKVKVAFDPSGTLNPGKIFDKPR